MNKKCIHPWIGIICCANFIFLVNNFFPGNINRIPSDRKDLGLPNQYPFVGKTVTLALLLRWCARHPPQFRQLTIKPTIRST